jgi:hypothetical protein
MCTYFNRERERKKREKKRNKITNFFQFKNVHNSLIKRNLNQFDLLRSLVAKINLKRVYK